MNCLLKLVNMKKELLVIANESVAVKIFIYFVLTTHQWQEVFTNLTHRLVSI